MSDPIHKEFQSEMDAYAWLMEHGRGKALHISVLHEGYCTQGDNSPCNCPATYMVDDMSVGRLWLNAKPEADWRDRHRSN